METSAKSVSAAVVEDGVPLASALSEYGPDPQPHPDAPGGRYADTQPGCGSRTWTLLAVAATGRAASPACASACPPLKGLAWAAEKPCCGVSTLAAMARNLAHMEGLIVCAMDARRNQVYNALFLAHDGVLTRQMSGPGHRPGGAGGGDEETARSRNLLLATGPSCVTIICWSRMFPAAWPRLRW